MTAVLLHKDSYDTTYYRDHCIIKQYLKPQYMTHVQEILKSLEASTNIIKIQNMDLSKLELQMEDYDTTLRLLDTNSLDLNIKLAILKQIARGIAEIHAKGLVHGEIKPSNIFIRTSDYHVVIGGFVLSNVHGASLSERCAVVYRCPIIQNNFSDDIYSFGICILELLGNVKLNRQPSFDEISEVIEAKISNVNHQRLLHNLLNREANERFSADEILNYLGYSV